MEKLPEKFSKSIYKYKDEPSPEEQTVVNSAENLTRPNSESLKNNVKMFISILAENDINLTDKNVRALEIGSGNAEFLSYAQRQGINIVGVDVRPRGVNDKQITARIERLPFPDETFDAIFSRGVFEISLYNQYPEVMMSEIVRVLKRGGMYVGAEHPGLPITKGFRLIKKPHFQVYKKRKISWLPNT